MRHLSLAIFAMLALSACSSVRGAAPAQPALGEGVVVAVNNMAAFPVVIRYYTPGGGPHFIGDVQADRTQRFQVPRSDVGHIFAETLDGERLDREHTRNLVRIRRLKDDRTS